MRPYRPGRVMGSRIGGVALPIAVLADKRCGMTHDEAIRIVAQWAVASARVHIEWEMYPEVGEHDWTRVQEVARELTPFPEAAAFSDAYALLEARANLGEGEVTRIGGIAQVEARSLKVNPVDPVQVATATVNRGPALCAPCKRGDHMNHIVSLLNGYCVCQALVHVEVRR